MLTPADRALLFRACWDHPVAKCARCDGSFKMYELAADVFRGLNHLCRNCLIDLSDAVRHHLLSCAAAAALDAQGTYGEARITREASADLRKEAQRLRDAAGVTRCRTEPTFTLMTTGRWKSVTM